MSTLIKKLISLFKIEGRYLLAVLNFIVEILTYTGFIFIFFIFLPYLPQTKIIKNIIHLQYCHFEIWLLICIFSFSVCIKIIFVDIQNMYIRHKILHRLTSTEKIILKKYIDNDTRAYEFVVNNPTITMFEKRKIVYRTSEMSFFDSFQFTYVLNEKIFLYLKKHQKLLK